jgi:hypothetical protein
MPRPTQSVRPLPMPGTEPEMMRRPSEPPDKPQKEMKGIWGMLYQLLGPPVAQGDAISAHSPEGIAYRERQRAARRQARALKRQSRDGNNTDTP